MGVYIYSQHNMLTVPTERTWRHAVERLDLPTEVMHQGQREHIPHLQSAAQRGKVAYDGCHSQSARGDVANVAFESKCVKRTPTSNLHRMPFYAPSQSHQRKLSKAAVVYRDWQTPGHRVSTAQYISPSRGPSTLP